MASAALQPNRSPAGRFAGAALLAVLLVAFVSGGGGSRFGLANLAVQLTAIAAIGFHRDSFNTFWRESSLALRGLIIAALLLPIIQIIPLPPAVWSALPGRDLVTRSLELTGGSGWMPISLDPLRTLLALTALITPLAILITGWKIPRERLVTLGWLVVGLGLITMLLGVLQTSGGNSDTTVFGARRPGEILMGTFANRNSTGLWLGFTLALAALLPLTRPHPALLFARLAVCALLVVAIVLTRSRTALVLAIVPIALGGLRALWWTLHERRQPTLDRNARRRPLILALAALALIATGAASLVVAAPGRLGEVLERFEAKDDPRRFIWDDATYSIDRYWPAGSGMGTFDEVFQIDESLENLTRRRAGRAHNDYIELAIEAGPFGLLVAAMWLVLVGWLSWRARRSPLRWAAWSGSAFLLTIALQSITDYPLRNQTMLAFAGFALLLLARIAGDSGRARQ